MRPTTSPTAIRITGMLNDMINGHDRILRILMIQLPLRTAVWSTIKPSTMRMRTDSEYEAREEGSKMSAITDLITTPPTREQRSDDTDDRWMTHPNQHACLVYHIEHKSSTTPMRMNPKCVAREPGTTQLPVTDPTPNPSSLTLDQSSLNTHCASEEYCNCGNYRAYYGAQHCEPCLPLDTRSSNGINANDNQTATARTEMASERSLFSEDRSDCMSEFTDIDSVSSVDPMWPPAHRLHSYYNQESMQSTYNIICSTAALLSTHTHTQQISVAGVDHCCVLVCQICFSLQDLF
jgi:hypothetical protein